MNYLVNEIFNTFQCEGTFAGVPAVFIRLQGCDVGCGFCDTKYTWDKKEEDRVIYSKLMKKEESGTPDWTTVNTETILGYLWLYPKIRHVVLTGGEPCLQDIYELIEMIERTGRTVQIETSGTEIVNCTYKTFVTLSPKIEIGNMKPMLAQPILRADEIKYVVGAESHIKKLDQMLLNVPVDKSVPIYLQPMSQLPKATEACMKLCMERGWKLSLQMHKYVAIR